MKSRSIILLEKSIAAMVAAIEIINKPKFPYREEIYLTLSVNSWELLLKSKWLHHNDNNERSLYVKVPRKNKDGTTSKKEVYKKNRCGNPLTHEITHVFNQIDSKISHIEDNVKNNLLAMIEARDNSIHFYSDSASIDKVIREIGLANIKNYLALVKEWFDVEPEELCDYILPISVIQTPASVKSLQGNVEEKQFINYILKVAGQQTHGTDKSVALSIDFKFNKSSTPGAIPVEITKHGAVAKIELTDEQIRDRYPLTHADLFSLLRQRYVDFKMDDKYNSLKIQIKGNETYAKVRYLDPKKPNSGSKIFYSQAVIKFFDSHYALRKAAQQGDAPEPATNAHPASRPPSVPAR